MEQGSKAWLEARKNKLTGSNVGAAIGVNPWKTPDDLIRQMVRDHHGAESEFTGNVATEYGSLHEPLAVMDYMTKTGNMPLECGFFVHPNYEWLGASPDALVDDEGVIEVKCPFGKRNDKDGGFKTAKEQPHYYAQMQVEMACTGRKWCDFFQWNKHCSVVERVLSCDEWWAENLPIMEAFYQRFLAEIDNPLHLEEKHKEINTFGAQAMLDEYDALGATIDDATARKKEVLAELVKMVKERNAVVCGRKLTLVERKGSVQYAKVVKEHLPDIDLTEYTGAPSEYWRLS